VRHHDDDDQFIGAGRDPQRPRPSGPRQPRLR
jgi:hypothetical protein